MMVGAPLLVSLPLGLLVIVLSIWLRKRRVRTWLLLLPSFVLMLTGIVFFYVGIAFIRGFEGASYSFIGLFLMIFSAVGIMVSRIQVKPASRQ
ncbi:YesK family protein [Priestia koreensis]|uniref:YesK family protein n=1 Tax=Priestia koreensis TaxID=284581 RepID=UPI0028F74882|nr:YesK family protein [Priestia koreensis]